MSRATTAALAFAIAAPLFAGVDSLQLELYANVPGSPIVLTHETGDDPDDSVYILTRTGTILSGPRNNPAALSTFMTVPGVDTFFEGGALGLAFHPDFQNNQLFYVYYTEDSNPIRSVVAEYTTMNNGAQGDPASERRLLTLEQNAGNHNGGWIGFSPNDGLLYISFGDDANSANGQFNATLKGKVLRIDPDTDDFPADPARNYGIPADNPFVGDPSAMDEIFVTGLRNPYRCSFDRATGDLYIADVGAGSFEEVSVIPADSGGGQNLGWACREGANCRSAACCNDPGFTEPVFDYSHANGCSITGGHVYRGCAIPDLDGTYFFADFCRNTINSFAWDGAASVTNLEFPSNVLTGVNSPAGFGEDSFGEIYVCSIGGSIFKITPTTAPADDNNNGIPDTCEASVCLGDCDNSGAIDFNDLVTMLFDFGTPGSTPACDADESGAVDFNDLVTTLFLFGPCK